MTKNAPPRDRYTFANTAEGKELRERTATNLAFCGITTEMSEETVIAAGFTLALLILTVTGKRPDEGQIARKMKNDKLNKEMGRKP